MTKTRNIADLLDVNGDVVSGALDNVPASNNASALTTGTLPSARLGTVTSFRSSGIDDNCSALRMILTNDATTMAGGLTLDYGSANGNPRINFAQNNITGNSFIEVDRNSLAMEFYNNGNERFRITSGGSVGIGTSSPNRLLTLGGTTNAKLALNASSYRNYTLGSDAYGFSIYDDTSTAYRLTVNNVGNVGIGTTSPSDKLHVEGSGTTGAIAKSTGSATAASVGAINNSGSQGKILMYGSGQGAYGSLGSGQMALYSNTAGMSIMNDNSSGAIKFSMHSGAEKMRISSAGKVSIGNTNASSFGSLATDLVIGTTSGEHGLTIVTGTGNSARMQFSDNTSSPFVGAIEYAHSSNSMIFYTSGSPAFRYAVGGLIIGKSGGTITDTGNYFGGNNGNNMVRAGGTVCGFNRETNDGTIIEFSGDGNIEGTISVSGTTVSYNGFTGTHWSRFTDNSTPTILRGTVLETLDEMCDWYNLEFGTTTTTQDKDGNDVTHTSRQIIPHVLLDSQSVGDTITYNHEGTDYQATITKETDIKHMMSKVSDNSDAKNVYGLFVAYDLDGEGYNDFYVASVGSYVVRIKSGETLAKGDLLQSNGDGTAKVQSDDNIKSSSFAKVLSTTIIETYEDGSYLVPCSLMC